MSVWLIPYGAPTMKIWSPTSTVSESPRGSGWTPAGTRSSWRSETSALGSEAMTRARMASPPRNSTVTSSAVWTMWAAVITLPSADTRTPEPRPRELVRVPGPAPMTSVSRVRTTTTDRFTRLKTDPRVSALAGEGGGHAAVMATSKAAERRMVALRRRLRTRVTSSRVPSLR